VRGGWRRIQAWKRLGEAKTYGTFICRQGRDAGRRRLVIAGIGGRGGCVGVGWVGVGVGLGGGGGIVRDAFLILRRSLFACIPRAYPGGRISLLFSSRKKYNDLGVFFYYRRNFLPKQFLLIYEDSLDTYPPEWHFLLRLFFKNF
jgi:hypothetical protein